MAVSSVMKAGVLSSPRNLSLQTVPQPLLEHDGVLIQTQFCGISGTCLRSYRGDFPGARYPTIPGLEVVGVVAAIGPGVTTLRPGQRVTVQPFLTCGRCSACQSGRYNCCAQLRLMGVHQPGGLADCVAMPAQRVYPVPDSLDTLTAVLCEPFSIGVQTIQRAQIDPGDQVVLLGCGLIGLAILLLARTQGAHVLVAEPNVRRAEIAVMMGADAVHRGAADTAQVAVHEFTDGAGAKVVIDATGCTEAIAVTTALAAPAGRVALVGVTGSPVMMSALEIVRKELDVYGVRNCGDAYPDAIRFVAEHQQQVAPFISEVLPMSRVADAFERADTHADNLLRVVVNTTC